MFTGSSTAGVRRTVSKNEERLGITMAVVPCLFLRHPHIARFRSISAYVRTQPVRTYAGKRQVLTYRGFLSDGGMIYSAQIDLKVGDSFEGDSFEKELSNGPEHRM